MLLSILYLLSIPLLRLKIAKIDYHFIVLLLLPLSNLLVVYYTLIDVLTDEVLFNQVPLGISLFMGVVTIYLFRDYFTRISPFKSFFRHLYIFYLYFLVLTSILYMFTDIIYLFPKSLGTLASILTPSFLYTAAVAFLFNVLTTLNYYKKGKSIR